MNSRYGIFNLIPNPKLEGLETTDSTDNTGVKGRIKRNIDFWEHTLKANSEILANIKEGCKINFTDIPSSAEFSNI